MYEANTPGVHCMPFSIDKVLSLTYTFVQHLKVLTKTQCINNLLL